MIKPISKISKLNTELRDVQDEYRKLQNYQEQCKYELTHFDINEYLETMTYISPGNIHRFHIERMNKIINHNRLRLKILRDKIKDIRNQIKSENIELNNKNKRKHKNENNG